MKAGGRQVVSEHVRSGTAADVDTWMMGVKVTYEPSLNSPHSYITTGWS